MDHTLSVSMIVKNEEQMLSRCLRSVDGADEIVVLDTGSTDRTSEVIKLFSNIKYIEGKYQWKDDFADARNECLKYCTGEWVLGIDADEYLDMYGIDNIRQLLKTIPDDVLAVDISCYGEGTNHCHHQPRLFKNHPDVYWIGAIHNHLSVSPKAKTDTFKVYYGYSPSHQKDPDRALRVLLKEYNKDSKSGRTLYYLAREYFYRNNWNESSKLFEQCVFHSRTIPERSDAYLYLARCYWNLHSGNIARNYCLNAILLNPQFKEAFLFLAEMSWPEQAGRWKEIAQTATNEGVWFIRA